MIKSLFWTGLFDEIKKSFLNTYFNVTKKNQYHILKFSTCDFFTYTSKVISTSKQLGFRNLNMFEIKFHEQSAKVL